MRGFAASEVHWLLVGCQKGVQFHSLVSAPLINTAENRQTFILQQKFKAFWKTAHVIPHYHSKSYIIIRMNFYYFYHNN